MKRLLFLSAALALCRGVAFADHKVGHTQNNPDAPGQDRVCLVTTSGGANGTVTDTKWLPRKAAQAQANNQTTFIGTNPLVLTEQGCKGFLG
jgi:hypothetical protein